MLAPSLFRLLHLGRVEGLVVLHDMAVGFDLRPALFKLPLALSQAVHFREVIAIDRRDALSVAAAGFLGERRGELLLRHLARHLLAARLLVGHRELALVGSGTAIVLSLQG